MLPWGTCDSNSDSDAEEDKEEEEFFRIHRPGIL